MTHICASLTAHGENCPQQAGSCLTLPLQMRSPSMPPKSCLTINWCTSMMHLEDALLEPLTMQVESTPLEPTQDLQELTDESKYDDE